jgi:hypothetical protein
LKKDLKKGKREAGREEKNSRRGLQRAIPIPQWLILSSRDLYHKELAARVEAAQ